MLRFPRLSALIALAALPAAAVVLSQGTDRTERFRERSLRAETRGLEEPFRGVLIGGELTPGLFPLHSTGVSTEPVRVASLAFLQTLTPDQRARTQFPVDDPEWRKWMNQHFYVRQGVGFDEMSPEQRDAAIGMMQASLSARGLQLTRDIMRLNHTLGELAHQNFEEYGEWLYWITMMGTPSSEEPWGWQLDGHHAIINYFVLGDQVVMSPLFVGSEPVVADSGKFAGTRILQEEQDQALAFVNALTPPQRSAAVIKSQKGRAENLGEAFRDNIDLDYVGVPARDLTGEQKRQLLELIGLYVGNMGDGHARVKMAEVAEHIDDTWFAWIGGTGQDDVFYYRILSPVVLIEFDHQPPVALRHIYPNAPIRQHIHALLRTPNGNDYGKDLLRQHYARSFH